MLISIIIVNYNGQKWLTDCFDSIFKQKIKSLEVIFVDNNSSDQSVDLVKKYYPTVLVHQSKTNLGFGRGNNLGADLATGELLFFLNTDTKLGSHCLARISELMLTKNIDLCGPKLLDFDGRDVYRGRKLTLDLIGSLSWGHKTTVLEGCALMIKKTVFESLKGFDSRFFMYSEDLDLCWRAWLRGYNIAICKEASVKHYGGGSSLPTMIGSQKHQVPVFRRFETEKNTLRMMIKNASLLHLILALPLMFVLITGEAFLYLITGQSSATVFLFKAIKWNLDHLEETLSQRKIVQKGKKRPNIWPLLAKKIAKFEVFKLIGIPSIKI